MQLNSLGKIYDASSSLSVLIKNGETGNLTLANTLKELDIAQKVATISQTNLSEVQKIGVLATSGLTAEELKNVVSTGALTSAQEKAEVSTNKLGSAWKGLASKLGLSVTQLNIATGALAALAVGSIAYKAYLPRHKQLIQSHY